MLFILSNRLFGGGDKLYITNSFLKHHVIKIIIFYIPLIHKYFKCLLFFYSIFFPQVVPNQHKTAEVPLLWSPGLPPFRPLFFPGDPLPDYLIQLGYFYGLGQVITKAV
jgi:hypothetical protein